MQSTKSLGRLGLLAATLGAGAAIAANSGVASAEAGIDWASLAPDASALLAAPAAAAAPDYAISFNGMSFEQGTATASSVAGSYGFALAYGDGATAASGGSSDSLFNTAIAEGAGANALSNGGNFGTAIASGADSTAYSNGIGNFVSATGYQSNASAALGDYNSVFANGQASDATVLGGDGNLLNVSGVGSLADTGGNSNIITIVGDNAGTNDLQAYVQGSQNILGLFGDGNDATVSGMGNITGIFGDGSSAFVLGDNNLAAAFGDLLNVTVFGSNMTDIEPSLTAASSMADLLGGADASWLTDLFDGSWLTGLF